LPKRNDSPVNGWLTFAEKDTKKNAWWIGFDCGHCYDSPDPDLMDEATKSFNNKMIEELGLPLLDGGVIRTQTYVQAECASLCGQALRSSKAYIEAHKNDVFLKPPISEQGMVIGMEWEPQLTLLDYPRKAVHVKIANQIRKPFAEDCGARSIILYIPRIFQTPRMQVDIGATNIEIESQPVLLADWEEELIVCEQALQDFITQLALHVGPIGVFLPRTFKDVESDALPVTKHINLSWPMIQNFYYEYNNLKAELMVAWKSGDVHQHRLHYRVDYDFTDIGELVKNLRDETLWINTYPTQNTMTAPIFLGYSHGKTFVQINYLR